jgi:hypothetical protein
VQLGLELLPARVGEQLAVGRPRRLGDDVEVAVLAAQGRAPQAQRLGRRQERQAVVLALDWDEGTDADEWAETVPRYLGAAFGAARDVVFARSGVRTAIVFAPSLGDGAAIAQAAVSG